MYEYSEYVKMQYVIYVHTLCTMDGVLESPEIEQFSSLSLYSKNRHLAPDPLVLRTI
jgi:hypothetical protein